jgi:hypothetical protein
MELLNYVSEIHPLLSKWNILHTYRTYIIPLWSSNLFPSHAGASSEVLCTKVFLEGFYWNEKRTAVPETRM